MQYGMLKSEKMIEHVTRRPVPHNHLLQPMTYLHHHSNTQLSFDNKIDLTQTIMLVIVGIPLLLVLIYKIQACIRTLFVRYRQQLPSKLPYIITPPLLRQKSHLYLKICDDKQMTILYFLDIPFEFSTTTFSQLPQIRSITTNPGLIKPSINISWTSTQNALVVAERACQINIALPDKIQFELKNCS